MVRSDLVELISQRFPQLFAQDADVSVKEITAAIASTLVKGGRVEIRGFGSFGLNYRPPRLARNPKTGDKVAVSAKWTQHFKPGKELRELVDAKCR